ncbi:TlpA disulfide reductase family protein [Winogradskyella helgolandensis]|uniref:TlpA disulfide reductase family protein n=1 Tax=Winogradskyella helgolandensis TaxID=2697010 RepID=UPI0015CC0852|nr:TlpA disulfide reductase family protein [Winogradskyella helgolandensis]
MKKLSLLLVILLFVMSCKNERQGEATSKTIGLLTISTEKPQPGETIDITYNNDNVIEAFYQYMVNTKNYPLDIDLTSIGNKHKSSLKIPDSAEAIAFIFKVNDAYDDNNKLGYILPLYNADGEEIPGSNSAAAFFTTSNGSYYGIDTKDEKVEAIIKKDLETYPDLKKDWETTYLQLAYMNDKKEGETLINSYLEALYKNTNKSEKDYMSMMSFYNTINQKQNSDSIETIILKKFPNGNTVSYNIADAFYAEKNTEKKEKLLATYQNLNPKSNNWGSNMTANLAKSYFIEGDMEKFEKYSSMIEHKESKAATFNNLAWSLAEKGKNLVEAAKLSKASIDLITELQNSPKDKPEYFTQKQYEENLKSAYNRHADTYALILFRQGNAKEAIKYQEKAHDPKGQDVEANARYISYLMADEQYETVLNKAEKFIKDGNSVEDIKKAYKTAYLKVNPESKDVEEKIITIEKEGHDKNISEIKSKMLDEVAPDFNIKNLDGEVVSLSALKGKIVILDFWATWCGPCIASFPAMQNIVTKYKGNDDVVFLFIDTLEDGEDRIEKVSKFIEKNKYDFNVLIDPKNKEEGTFEVANTYNITGIPTKVIIGSNGRMNFKSVGYSGSAEKTVNEIDIIVELLKKS